MKNTVGRALISVAVFIIIYFLSGPMIGWTNYDMYLKGIEYLAAVIGAGCFGSEVIKDNVTLIQGLEIFPTSKNIFTVTGVSAYYCGKSTFFYAFYGTSRTYSYPLIVGTIHS